MFTIFQKNRVQFVLKNIIFGCDLCSEFFIEDFDKFEREFSKKLENLRCFIYQ